MPNPIGSTTARKPQSPSSPTHLAIEATDLVKTYATGRGKPPVQALDGLSLTVRQGEVFGLLGPNGAGKSTTVKILSTLTRPDDGRAVVAGHDVTSDPDAVRRAIGLISQKSSSAPMMTGRESVLLAARIHGMSRSRGAIQGHRAARPLRAHGRSRPPHQDLQRRHAAQARHRRGPGRPANRALPRRAHDRPRPRGAHADVGRDRPPGRGRTADGPAHDALPRRGRPSRRPARDRRPRSPRRRGHPRRAQAPAQRRRRRRGGRRPDGREPLLQNAFRTSPGSTTSATRVGSSGPEPVRPPVSSRASWRRWTRPAWRSNRRPSPDRVSTTSTSTTPAARSTSKWSHGDTGRRPGSRKEPTDDRSPDPLRAADPPVADRVGAATRVPAHHPHPADDLAAAVRTAVLQGHRDPRVHAATASRSSPSSPPVSS